MLHLAMMSAKSFFATGGEEEAVLLLVKMIAKAKPAFPVDAELIGWISTHTAVIGHMLP